MQTSQTTHAHKWSRPAGVLLDIALGLGMVATLPFGLAIAANGILELPVALYAGANIPPGSPDMAKADALANDGARDIQHGLMLCALGMMLGIALKVSLYEPETYGTSANNIIQPEAGDSTVLVNYIETYGSRMVADLRTHGSVTIPALKRGNGPSTTYPAELRLKRGTESSGDESDMILTWLPRGSQTQDYRN